MRYILFCIVFIGFLVKVSGQNTIALPIVKNYSKATYRGGSQTWAIDQDSKGRIYFANNEGLITFDGTYWKTYPLPNKTIVRSVKVATDGKVFVGGQGEAGFFLPDASGELKFYSILNLVPEQKRDFADVWGIEMLGNSVFFRTTDQLLHFANQTVEVFPAPVEWVYLEKVKGRLFAQDKTTGLFLWSGMSWDPVTKDGIGAGDPFHGAIASAGDSLVFITYYRSAFLFTGEELTVTNMVNLPLKSEIAGIVPLNKEEYAIGTTGEGLWVVNHKGQPVQHISKMEGLQDNSILCLFADKDGNIWTGLNNGISMVAYNSPLKFIRPSLDNELTVYGSYVHKEKLYFATNDGAYTASLDNWPKDLGFARGVFQRIPKTGGLAYRFDEVNRKLMLAHNEGIFSLTEGRVEKVSGEPSWLCMPVSQVFPTGKVLVGTYKGLKWLKYSNGDFLEGQNLEGLRESFRFLAIDNEQQVWASHPYRGVYKINFSKDSLRYSATLFTEKDGLPSRLDNHVFRVKSRVVFATSAGIFEFNKSKYRFEPSNILSSMFGNTPIRYLMEDKAGNLWFVQDKKLGYLAYHPQKDTIFSITYFPEITGQILSGFENIYAYDRENVFVASEKGVILINPEKYLKTKSRPSIILSSVHALGTSDSLIYYGFNPTAGSRQKVKLPYTFNSLHFEYSSPAYGFQENMEYSYILEGYEKEWSKWTTRSEKDYTNLPSGNYTFKVKGRSNLGTESEMESYAFSIAPPWYKSAVASIFYSCCLAFSIYLLHFYHRKKLARQKRLYEEKQEQLRVLHQLEMEKNEKEIIRLQIEKLANEVSFKNRELADTTMHLVERSDALGKVKETLERLYKYDTSNIDLKRAIHLMNDIDRNNTDWDRFAASFDEINNDFLKKLKARFPVLTPNDQKLCAYLQLNMTSKEIAQLLNISIRGVEISRYRLRKKLGVPTDVSINDFLHTELGNKTST